MVRPPILILDDEPDICLTLGDYLRDLGCRCACRMNGSSALRLLERRHVSLAILDMRLPDTDGETFMRRAKRIQPHLRFVIHTGSLDCQRDSVRERLLSQAEAVILKPVADMSCFHALVRTLEGGPA